MTILAGLAALVVYMHPVHTAAAELDLTRPQVVAVLRVFRDDLELDLGRGLDASHVGRWAEASFGVACGGDPVRLAYSRHELAGDMIRIELRGAHGRRGACRTRFTAFFGRFGDQVNLVRVHTGRARRTLVFVPGDGWKAVA